MSLKNIMCDGWCEIYETVGRPPATAAAAMSGSQPASVHWHAVKESPFNNTVFLIIKGQLDILNKRLNGILATDSKRRTDGEDRTKQQQQQQKLKAERHKTIAHKNMYENARLLIDLNRLKLKVNDTNLY